MNEKMRSSVMGLILGQFSSPLPMAQKEPVETADMEEYLRTGDVYTATGDSIPVYDKE